MTFSITRTDLGAVSRLGRRCTSGGGIRRACPLEAIVATCVPACVWDRGGRRMQREGEHDSPTRSVAPRSREARRVLRVGGVIGRTDLALLANKPLKSTAVHPTKFDLHGFQDADAAAAWFPAHEGYEAPGALCEASMMLY